MADLGSRLEAAKAEVVRLERQAAQASCAEVGHSWKSLGGCNAGCEIADACSCSVPVHECERCGDCDYGENAEALEIKIACTEQMMLDDPDYQNRACEVCGAKTEQEAANACRSYQIPSGDYTCDGHPEETSYPDGRLRFLSEIGIANINKWVDEQVAAMKEAAPEGDAAEEPANG